MAVYQSDPEMASDTGFEPGALHHLVPGNTGRMLDARRTPVRVVGLRTDLALVELEVLAFEDRGARWELPANAVDRYQFAMGEPRAPDAVVATLVDVERSFGEPLDIPIDTDARRSTLDRLATERAMAVAWLDAHSRWASDAPALDLTAAGGDPQLFADLADFLEARGLAAMDATVMRQYVSHPGAWEVVTGHAIVAAELGLAAYRGPAVRDPSRMSGDWSRERRADHLVARMAFTSAMLTLAGHTTVELYRGMSFEHRFEWRRSGPFTSATFERSLAEQQSTLGPNRSMALLAIQRVPVDRLIATYHETAAMNAAYQEHEALLIAADDTLF